jgi:hypothetical protein
MLLSHHQNAGQNQDIKIANRCFEGGHTVAYWLRHYATSQKVADRIPMRWIFSNLPNPSGCTMALGSTQPLTEMSTRDLKKKETMA